MNLELKKKLYEKNFQDFYQFYFLILKKFN